MSNAINIFEHLNTRLKAQTIGFTVAVAMSAVSTPGIAASVTSIGSENFAQYGKENAFWEASVSCADVEDQRVIQRKTDGEMWCPKGASEELCDESKDKAASNACSDTYAAIIEQEALDKKQAEQAQIARERAEQERRRQQEQARREQAAAEAEARQKVSAQEAKLRNKISIQEARIKLDQEKLELRRRELALERRALEIEDILATLEEE